MDTTKALNIISKINPDKKFEAMITIAGIITKLLEPHNIKPIVVGGLSVELYTQNDYTTRDVDFVTDGQHIIEEILPKIGFKKAEEAGSGFVHEELEVFVEIPDSYLEGDESRVQVVKLEDENELYIYVISIEDIINDRLRASIYWNSENDAIWGFQLLARNYDSVDRDYLYSKLDVVRLEKPVLDEWFAQLDRDYKV